MAPGSNDYHLKAGSKAIDTGVDVSALGITTDLDDQPRAYPQGKTDVGAYEVQPTCQNGATEACYTGAASTRNKGLCKDGTRTCQNDKWGPCQGEVKPKAEACDTRDNDCDGKVDENDADAAKPLSRSCQGACSPGSQTCTQGAWGSCQAPPCGQEPQPGQERDESSAESPTSADGASATEAQSGETTVQEKVALERAVAEAPSSEMPGQGDGSEPQDGGALAENPPETPAEGTASREGDATTDAKNPGKEEATPGGCGCASQRQEMPLGWALLSLLLLLWWGAASGLRPLDKRKNNG